MAAGGVLVLGATGQLGADVVDAFRLAGWEVLGLSHSDVDVTDGPAVLAAVSAAHPSLVVNTAAFHHLDRCEEDQASAYAVNAMGARNVAAAAADTGAALIHISTDYVFDGAKGSLYEEPGLPGAPQCLWRFQAHRGAPRPGHLPSSLRGPHVRSITAPDPAAQRGG